MSVSARPLHFVLKIGSLKSNIEFFRDALGMKVLRHEVFDKGCEAACNGPYHGKWSKTMIGYGPEDDHFVLELTYNYSIGSYKLGNDLQYIKMAIKSDLYKKLAEQNKQASKDTFLSLQSPDGYKFIISELPESQEKQDLTEVCLSCDRLERSTKYWIDLLKMRACDELNGEEAVLKYADGQACLRLKEISRPVEHATAYGRIAFSCPSDELQSIQKAVETAKQRVLTPYLSLDTPGKATVQVVILSDPDEHEICFVGDEGFRELSKVDPKANDLIEKSIAEDKSDEWFKNKGMEKNVA